MKIQLTKIKKPENNIQSRLNRGKDYLSKLEDRPQGNIQNRKETRVENTEDK